MVALRSICFSEHQEFFLFRITVVDWSFVFPALARAHVHLAAYTRVTLLTEGRSGILVRWPQTVLALALPS